MQRRRRTAAAYLRHGAGRRVQVILGLALLSMVLAAGLFVSRLWSVLHAIAPLVKPADVLSIVRAQPEEPGSLAWKIKHDERINILLLGYGGPGHDGPYLTDSTLLVSLRPGLREAVLINLPRDWWVKIPALPNGRFMWQKLNAAYAIGIDRDNFPNVREDWKTPTGGGDLAAATVADITGQHIDYWIGVDFKAFEDVVNALNGIDITVPEVLDDPYFPLGETTGYMRIHFNAGAQHMNGERALQYARSRETTSDFDRSRRQQLILLSVRSRVLSLNAVPRLFALLGALQDNVRTNLRISEMRQLAELASQFKDADIRRISIDNTNLLRDSIQEDGLYVLLPRDPSYATVQRFLALALPDREPLQVQVPIQIHDGTLRYALPWPNTPASVMTGLLHDLGWNAKEGPSVAGQRLARTEIRDASGGAAPATVAWLHELFGGTVVAVPLSETTSGITVVLGSDFTLAAFPGPPPPPAPPPPPRPTAAPSPTSIPVLGHR